MTPATAREFIEQAGLLLDQLGEPAGALARGAVVDRALDFVHRRERLHER